MTLFGLSLGEFVTGSTLLYVICVAAFNAGYYSQVDGRFIEVFSFAEMLGANVPILQYFLSIYGIYGILTLPLAWATAKYGPTVKRHIELHMLLTHYSWRLFYAGFVFLFCAFILLNALIADLPYHSFTLEILPYAVFQGVLFYFYWVGYQADIVAARTVLFMFVLTVVYFAQNTGRVWLKSEITSGATQSFLLVDSQCLERILLRSTSNGFLLFDPSTKQFEYRDHGTIKMISGKNLCV
jgi:hypothetical protein